MRYAMVRLCLAGVVAATSTTAARGDGGALRACERVGPYQIAVFTSPTPLRAGFVDISVLVQDAATGALATDVQVVVRVGARHYPATTGAATNKLFRAAHFEWPTPERCAVEISVEGPRGAAAVHLDVEVAAALPRWQEMWPWFSWPALAIALFVGHQAATRRRCQSGAAAIDG